MNAVQLRSDIDKYLDQADEVFLNIVHAMLKTYDQQKKKQDVIIGYRLDGKPLKAMEAKEEFAQRIEEMEKGDYVSFDDLEKEAKEW